jgi:Na+/proline symporter
MHWWGPHVLQVMFDPEHGYFFWTPLALVAIVGLVLLARRSREGAILLLMVGLQFYIGGSVESWTVAGGFGQRRLVAISTGLVIGYACLWDRARARGARAALVTVTVLTVYWNLALTAEFATGLMDRQKLEPRKNAYDAFVTLPRRAPSLAYRYLFDRSSFYQRANPLPR